MDTRKSLVCRVGIHQWQDVRNDDGVWFSLCHRCGTSKDKIIFMDSPGGMA
jgi:hypothetical protein